MMDKSLRSTAGSILRHTLRNVRQMWPLRYIVGALIAMALVSLSYLGSMLWRNIGYAESVMYIFGGLTGRTDLPGTGGYIDGGVNTLQIAALLIPVLILLLVQGKYLEVAMRSYCRILVPRIGSLSVWWSSLQLSQIVTSLVFSAASVLITVGWMLAQGREWGMTDLRWGSLEVTWMYVMIFLFMRCVFMLQLQTLIMVPLVNPIAGLLIPFIVSIVTISMPAQSPWFPFLGGVMAGVYMGETSMAAVACSGVLWYLALAAAGWLLVRRRDFLIAAI